MSKNKSRPPEVQGLSRCSLSSSLQRYPAAFRARVHISVQRCQRYAEMLSVRIALLKALPILRSL